MMRLLFINGNITGVISRPDIIVGAVRNLLSCLLVFLASFRTLFINITKAIIGVRPSWRVDLSAFQAISVILFTRNKPKANGDKYNDFFHKINFTQKYSLLQCQ